MGGHAAFPFPDILDTCKNRVLVIIFRWMIKDKNFRGIKIKGRIFQYADCANCHRRYLYCNIIKRDKPGEEKLMRNKRFEAMQKEVAGNFDHEKGERIAGNMKKEYEELCSNIDEKNDKMAHHKQNNIYPVVTAFHALIKEGMTRKEAAEIADKSFLVLMEDIAESIRKMMKFPGAYKLMPALWKKMMPKLFSPESGFEFKIQDTGKDQVKFDMTACPYMEVCRELDCMELAGTFCTTDDVCYGNMHPKLIWNRTKTLAKNGEPCDFDLYIKK